MVGTSVGARLGLSEHRCLRQDWNHDKSLPSVEDLETLLHNVEDAETLLPSLIEDLWFDLRSKSCTWSCPNNFALLPLLYLRGQQSEVANTPSQNVVQVADRILNENVTRPPRL